MVADPHMNEDNIEEVTDILIQSMDLCKELKLSTIYIIGDIFTTRKSMPLAVLLGFMNILDVARSKGVDVKAFPGNHDKLDYTSELSYLHPFMHHPAFCLYDSYDEEDIEIGVRLHLIPFFEEKEIYPKYLKQVNLLKKGRNYLLTHIAVNGVRNNDGSVIENQLNQDLFYQFDKVFVGHYHDASQVGDNVFYIGSTHQNNYGENQQKGFTVLYSDGSHQLHLSKYKKYEVVNIDLDESSHEEVEDLKRKWGDKDDMNVRFNVTGSVEKIQAIDKYSYDILGIDIKCKERDVNVDVSFEESTDFGGFDRSNVIGEWDEFSEKNEEIDGVKGKKLLIESI